MDDFKLFIELAFTHVLDWQAYDHILFFIVLTVVYDFKDWKKGIWLINYTFHDRSYNNIRISDI